MINKLKHRTINESLQVSLKEILESSNQNKNRLILTKDFSNIAKTTEGIEFNNIDFDEYIIFTNDEFKLGNLTLQEIERKNLSKVQTIKTKDIKRVYFYNCKFDFIPTIKQNDIWLIEFNECIFNDSFEQFHNTLLTYTRDEKKVYFNNCKFNDFTIGDISDIRYNLDTKLSYFEINGGVIDNFIVQNIEIVSKFYINKQYDGNNKQLIIKNLEFNQVTFKENFKLHNCDISQCYIKDTDFEKHADFFMSSFKKGKEKNIEFKAINFKGLALFGDTKFSEKLVFRYVTFEGYVHFRQAVLKKGIDLDYSNIQNEINFYAINILDYSSMTKESFRIIKYHLEKIGNKIEANKYHSLELNQNRKDIWNKDEVSFDLIQRGLVAILHKISSNHSQSWVLALFWIVVVAIITEYFVTNMNSKFSSIYLNHVIQYASILTKRDMFCENNIAFVLNKVLLGYLYYQFLISIRKDTRK